MFLIKYFLSLIFVFISSQVYSQYEGPVTQIANGFGAQGLNAVSVANLTNNHFLLKDISVFYPTGTMSPIPTIFFLHGYGGNDTINYIETLRNLSSNGYAVVFVPYKTVGVTISERYLTLYDGAIKAAQSLTSIIDTTRVGFYGHSFGGGAAPRISYRLFTEHNWGTNGKFLYCSAPWYSFELGDSTLSNYPPDCNMLTVLFDNDVVNDHRMGMDIFNNIAIDDSIKDCVMVYNDTVLGYIYDADHSLPAQYSSNGVYNAYDYYIPFRLLGALADYTFTGDILAKNVALGNGSQEQIYMGSQLSPLFVTDNPIPIYTETKYNFPCSDAQNERRDFCQEMLEVEVNNSTLKNIQVYPNPTSNYIIIETEYKGQLYIINQLGNTIKKVTINQFKTSINMSNFDNGIYVLKFKTNNTLLINKILKK
jgi:hypothetical protein